MQVCKAAPGDKPVRLFDEKGLYLEVRPAGGKWWRFNFGFGSKKELLALGTYPEVSLKQARDRRYTARRHLSEGGRSFASAQVREGHASPVQNTRSSSLRATGSRRTHNSQLTIGRSLENDVFPELGARPMAEITPIEIRKAVQRIEARGAGEDSQPRVSARAASSGPPSTRIGCL